MKHVASRRVRAYRGDMFHWAGSATGLTCLTILVSVLPIACVTTHTVTRPVTQDVIDQLKTNGIDRATKVEYALAPRTEASPEVGAQGSSESHGKTESAQGVLVRANLRRIELHANGDDRRQIPLSDVRIIRITNRGLGCLYGVFAGMLAGAAGGAFLGSRDSGSSCSNGYDSRSCPSTLDRALIFGLGGLAIGAGIGALLGLAVGDNTTFVFRDGDSEDADRGRPVRPVSGARGLGGQQATSPAP
jgi:hypothetical protein